MFKSDDSDDIEELFIELNQKVRFQVNAIKYTEQQEAVNGITTSISETSIPLIQDEKKDTTDGVIKRQRSTSVSSVGNKNIKKPIPMEIQGSMVDQGLGVIAWWQ